MSVQVTFAGTNYSVPEEEDLGWEDLTDYLVALSSAQSGTFDVKSWRVSTSASNSISASDDYALAINCSTVAGVTLPVGSTGQIFVIADVSGAALTNNITIGGTGQNINGRASYTIRSNYGVVALQFGTTEWNVINSREITIEQNTTNLAIIDAAVAVDNTGVSVNNLQSSTFTFTGAACEFIVSADSKAMRCCCSIASNTVDCLWDTDNMFLASDAGTGIVVTKSTGTVTVKNRLGTAADFKIRLLVGQVTSATGWA